MQLAKKTASGKPTVEMVELSGVDYNACQGAKVSFIFSSRADRSKARAKQRMSKP